MVYELDLNFSNYKKKKKSTKSLDSFHIHFRDQQGRREQTHLHTLHP